MNKDMDLINSLAELASKNTIEYIIETGTHRGLGSTTMLGNAFKNSSSLKSLNTIEIDYTNYTLAKKNLSQFNFINCHYGCSLDLNDAIAYVKQDEAILHHEKYPEVFIDNAKDPINFYVNELEGRLNDSSNNIIKQFLKKILRSLFSFVSIVSIKLLIKWVTSLFPLLILMYFYIIKSYFFYTINFF
jgi:predicted O-methyltransferase YrrM